MGKEKDAEEETIMEAATVQYCSWDQAMHRDWSAVRNKDRELRLTSWLYFGLQGEGERWRCMRDVVLAGL